MPETSTTQGPWWRRRFVAFAFLLGLCGALAGGVALAYPSPDSGISVPASPVLGLYTLTPVRHLDYSVSQVSTGVSELVVTVSGGFAQGATTPIPPPTASNGTLTITLPPGFRFEDCPPGCHEPANGDPAFDTVPVAFGTEGAARTFMVSAPHFGTNNDGVFAYAAIPEVSYLLSTNNATSSAATALTLGAPTFRVSYRIPSAGSYDWSSSPPTVSGSAIMWQQLLSTGDSQGRAAAGVNHNAESDNATWTFVAGILAGFAGGALLAAIQVLLPTGDGSRS